MKYLRGVKLLFSIASIERSSASFKWLDKTTRLSPKEGSGGVIAFLSEETSL